MTNQNAPYDLLARVETALDHWLVDIENVSLHVSITDLLADVRQAKDSSAEENYGTTEKPKGPDTDSPRAAGADEWITYSADPSYEINPATQAVRPRAAGADAQPPYVTPHTGGTMPDTQPTLEERPQDEYMDGRDWTFKTIEHGGEYPDMMPQAILATDAQGRSCVYVYRPPIRTIK